MTIRTLSAAVAAMVAVLLPVAPAPAQFFSTFVSSTGDDAKDCSTVANACRSFQRAHNQTAGGGQIRCIDLGGDFSNSITTITKGLAIDCGSTTATSSEFEINAPGAVVTIRNLTATSTFGIVVDDGAVLIVENCVFRAAGGSGIKFQPKSAGTQLVVSNSLFDQNGSGGIGGGIIVNPQGSGSAVVSLDRVTVTNNVFGIVADGSASTAGIAMVVRNSTVHRNNNDGIVATTASGKAPIGLTVKNTASVSNNNGIRATGPGVTVRVDNATVMHNAAGLVASNGATLLSAGNNTVEANGANGAFSGTYALK